MQVSIRINVSCNIGRELQSSLLYAHYDYLFSEINQCCLSVQITSHGIAKERRSGVLGKYQDIQAGIDKANRYQQSLGGNFLYVNSRGYWVSNKISIEMAFIIDHLKFRQQMRCYLFCVLTRMQTKWDPNTEVFTQIDVLQPVRSNVQLDGQFTIMRRVNGILITI